MDDKKLIQILNRGISKDLVNLDVGQLMDEKILITGAKGSIGTALVKELEAHKELNFLATDIEDGYEILDITNEDSVKKNINQI
jgi:FlaA1/EpsC-like NDP-sugar epimerase